MKTTTSTRLVALAGLTAVALTGCGGKTTASTSASSTPTPTALAAKAYTGESLSAVLTGKTVGGEVMQTAAQGEVDQAMGQVASVMTAARQAKTVPAACGEALVASGSKVDSDVARAMAAGSKQKAVVMLRSRKTAAEAADVVKAWDASNTSCKDATLTFPNGAKATTHNVTGTMTSKTATGVVSDVATTTADGKSSKEAYVEGSVGNVVIAVVNTDGSMTPEQLQPYLEDAAELVAKDLQKA